MKLTTHQRCKLFSTSSSESISLPLSVPFCVYNHLNTHNSTIITSAVDTEPLCPKLNAQRFRVGLSTFCQSALGSNKCNSRLQGLTTTMTSLSKQQSWYPSNQTKDGETENDGRNNFAYMERNTFVIFRCSQTRCRKQQWTLRMCQTAGK